MKIHSSEFKKGKITYKGLVDMTKEEEKIFKEYDKKVKAGKMVYFTYRPDTLMLKFITKYDLDVKKDKLGNVTVKISEVKKK